MAGNEKERHCREADPTDWPPIVIMAQNYHGLPRLSTWQSGA